ncbi:hypothetical protein, partial [Syntrophaceticus schinkii]|uniref:hypothetical protein n=1 Tax=Syntrophaceticus schinkii TaxID=499207 RepID=UPI001E307AED
MARTLVRGSQGRERPTVPIAKHFLRFDISNRGEKHPPSQRVPFGVVDAGGTGHVDPGRDTTPVPLSPLDPSRYTLL